MPTFDDFFGWTSHIDIYSSSACLLDHDGSLGKHLWIFAKYLEDHWLFFVLMGKDTLAKGLGVDESISGVKLGKCHDIGSDTLHHSTIRRVTVSIHRRESDDGSFFSEIGPVSFMSHDICTRVAHYIKNTRIWKLLRII